MTRHPGDERWALKPSSGHRPSIGVIERPEHVETARERWNGLTDDQKVLRAPLGFARVLLEDPLTGEALCGYPHARRPRVFGGCELRHGHRGGHRYNARKTTGIRPDTTRHSGGHAAQQPGTGEPTGAPS